MGGSERDPVIATDALLRTWHLQLAILWIATAFLAGGLFIAPSLGGRDPAYQSFGVNLLLVRLVVVVAGSLLGEWLGIRQMLGRLWEWFGDQGWEYLDLGKAWQIGWQQGSDCGPRFCFGR
jgi:nitric oxide reductase subunit B